MEEARSVTRAVLWDSDTGLQLLLFVLPQPALVSVALLSAAAAVEGLLCQALAEPG